MSEIARGIAATLDGEAFMDDVARAVNPRSGESVAAVNRLLPYIGATLLVASLERYPTIDRALGRLEFIDDAPRLRYILDPHEPRVFEATGVLREVPLTMGKSHIKLEDIEWHGWRRRRVEYGITPLDALGQPTVRVEVLAPPVEKKRHRLL